MNIINIIKYHLKYCIIPILDDYVFKIIQNILKRTKKWFCVSLQGFTLKTV